MVIYDRQSEESIFSCSSFPKCACISLINLPMEEFLSHKRNPLNFSVVWQWKSRIIVVLILRGAYKCRSMTRNEYFSTQRWEKRLWCAHPQGIFCRHKKASYQIFMVFFSSISSLLNLRLSCFLFCKFYSWDFNFFVLFIWARTTEI